MTKVYKVQDPKAMERTSYYSTIDRILEHYKFKYAPLVINLSTTGKEYEINIGDGSTSGISVSISEHVVYE